MSDERVERFATGGPPEPVERRLAELGRRTAGIRPRAGFGARVMAAVAADAAGAFRREIARSARWFVPIALALTVVSVGWAARARSVSSAAVAAAELRSELEW